MNNKNNTEFVFLDDFDIQIFLFPIFLGLGKGKLFSVLYMTIL